MPLYYFLCPACKASRRKILTPKEVGEANVECMECGAVMERDPQPPSTRITETLDNGAMVRKVERPANAEEMYRERAHGKKGNI